MNSPELTAPLPPHDAAVTAANRDGYNIVGRLDGYLLLLHVDADLSEGLKKNFCAVIAPDGLTYTHRARPHRPIRNELLQFLAEIKEGKHDGAAWR